MIIAIDGRAASGKTTLAKSLASELCAGLFHMDDFFLPEELRTAKRLAQPGGNIHHERFAEEVLPYIKGNSAFSYRIFDCAKADYKGTREILPAPIHIVEGSYSCHPVFGDYMDLRVFCDISPEEQLRRIELRNGKKAAKIFAAKWIPLEEKYFKFYEIMQRADVKLAE